MRLLRRHLEKDGAGEVRVVPEEEEDMWHIYNILSVGDTITAQTFRKVTSTSSTGSTSSQRVKLTVTLHVDDVDFDTQACRIRVKGRNAAESAHMKMGQSHTVELALHRTVSIAKSCWDTIYLERIQTACDPAQRADLVCVVMQSGLAYVCLMTAHMSVTRAKIEVSVPKKRAGRSGHDKAVRRFYEQVMEAVQRHVNWEVVKCVVLASPAFIKDEFFAYMMEQAQKRDLRDILSHRDRFCLAHAPSGHKHSLKEVLQDPAVAARVSDTKTFGEVTALKDFFHTLHVDPDRAFYGYNHVRLANEQKAVQTLLVTDGLFRSLDIAERRKYVALVEEARDNGAEVHVFSSLHVSGEQLAQMTGIAAVLRFPLPDIDLIFSDDSDSEGDGEEAKREEAG